MSPVLLVRLRTTCVSVAVTRARPALTRSARGRLGGSCVRWGRARALAAPGTLCRRSGDFPLGGRGALEEPVSSVRGLASRSSEHPGVRGPPPPPYMRRGAGVPSRTERASFAAPVSLLAGLRRRRTDREAAGRPGGAPRSRMGAIPTPRRERCRPGNILSKLRAAAPPPRRAARAAAGRRAAPPATPPAAPARGGAERAGREPGAPAAGRSSAALWPAPRVTSVACQRENGSFCRWPPKSVCTSSPGNGRQLGSCP